MSTSRRVPLRFYTIFFYGVGLFALGFMELMTIPLGLFRPYDEIAATIFGTLMNIGAALVIITLLPTVHTVHRKHGIVKRIEEMIGSIDFSDYHYSHSRPAYLLADSVDRMILEILKGTGGDFEVIPEMIATEGVHVDDSPGEEYERKLAKLVSLGFLAIPNKRYKNRLHLTARALDALNAPASLFVTNIPDDVWQHVFRMKLSLRKEDWDAVAVHMSAAIELMLSKRINEVRNRDKKGWAEMVKRNPRLENPLGAGTQLAALRSLRDIESGSFEDLLIGELNEIRNRIHPKEGETTTAFEVEEGRKIDLYLDILLQSWYGFR